MSKFDYNNVKQKLKLKGLTVMTKKNRYFITYRLNGECFTLRQSAIDKKDAERVAKLFAQKQNLEFVQVSSRSPRLRVYFGPSSSISTYVTVRGISNR